jgi:hypothetical protein
LKVELMKILDEEEMYWYKRSHENWLLKADNNTAFSTELLMEKKKTYHILSTDDDVNVSGDENLLKHATEYYKWLFGPGIGDALTLDHELWPEGDKVNTQENVELVQPFTEEEVKSALDQMEKNKAAGPDSFPIEFFQKCWSFIKQDMLEMFGDFYGVKLDIKRINYGIITLIPKSKEAVKI